MSKSDPNTDYTVAATFVLEGLSSLIAELAGTEEGGQPTEATAAANGHDSAKRAEGLEDAQVAPCAKIAEGAEDIEGADAAKGEYFIPEKENALLQLTREWLKIASCRTEKVSECMQVLLLELRDLREIAQRGNSRRGNSERDRLLRRKKEQDSDKIKYEEAKQYLDKGALLLGLPSGYFYRHVEKYRLSRSVVDAQGRRKTVLCQNCAEHDDSQWLHRSGVPRFVGESPEYYFRRLPPKDRDTPWYERKQQELITRYSVRGGGPVNEHSERRFRAAACILIGTFVPKDAINPYQLIADLLKLCGIERIGKDVRQVIVERERWAGEPILGSNPCVAALGDDQRN